jgi:hypothetical protein
MDEVAAPPPLPLVTAFGRASTLTLGIHPSLTSWLTECRGGSSVYCDRGTCISVANWRGRLWTACERGRSPRGWVSKAGDCRVAGAGAWPNLWRTAAKPQSIDIQCLNAKPFQWAGCSEFE